MVEKITFWLPVTLPGVVKLLINFVREVLANRTVFAPLDKYVEDVEKAAKRVQRDMCRTYKPGRRLAELRRALAMLARVYTDATAYTAWTSLEEGEQIQGCRLSYYGECVLMARFELPLEQFVQVTIRSPFEEASRPGKYSMVVSYRLDLRRHLSFSADLEKFLERRDPATFVVEQYEDRRTA